MIEARLNQDKNVFFYRFPIIGETAVAEDRKGICAVFIIKNKPPRFFDFDEFLIKETQLIKNMAKQLEEFFANKRSDFDAPLSLTGTAFEQRIYKELIKIRFGETVSYKELAALSENPAAVRATGAACGKNPLLILVPCHRCISSDGGLRGFAAGIEVKQQLLSLEKR